jgi:hypothetical protein
VGDHARQPRTVQQQPRCCAARVARLKMRCAVIVQTARIGAPLIFELGPRFGFRFGRPGRFLRGRQLLRARRTIDDDQIVVRPVPQAGGTLRPRLNAFLGDCGDLGHPGKRIHRSPFHAELGVQLVAQGGLIHDAGGFGFVEK